MLKGNKPDFHCAMGGENASKLFDIFVSELKKGHVEEKIQTGVFGAMMKVELENDGPVTIEINSPEKKKEEK